MKFIVTLECTTPDREIEVEAEDHREAARAAEKEAGDGWRPIFVDSEGFGVVRDIVAKCEGCEANIFSEEEYECDGESIYLCEECAQKA